MCYIPLHFLSIFCIMFCIWNFLVFVQNKKSCISRLNCGMCHPIRFNYSKLISKKVFPIKPSTLDSSPWTLLFYNLFLKSRISNIEEILEIYYSYYWDYFHCQTHPLRCDHLLSLSLSPLLSDHPLISRQRKKKTNV